MSEKLEKLKKLIDECTVDDLRALKTYLGTLLPHRIEREWNVDADTILSAIDRSSDLTKRGVRGIIAEAVFVHSIIPGVAETGWKSIEVNGDQPYDVLLQKNERTARIQVKLQRLEEGVPKLYYPKHYAQGSLFVVEVQKTRTGIKSAVEQLPASGTALTTTRSVTVNTRPYSFSDFDILAVNMHPSTRDWKNFRFTVAAWLIPRVEDKSLIEIFQPVAATPNHVWTDNLSVCLEWLESGAQRRILDELLHIRPNRRRSVGRNVSGKH